MFAVQATGQLYEAAAFRPIIVTYATARRSA